MTDNCAGSFMIILNKKNIINEQQRKAFERD